MPPNFVFQMQNMSKFYTDKPVLQNFNLSFYLGAKIGIVGENGSGKSTLLRIMAGLDTEIQGTAQISKGCRALLVPQEPRLNPEKNVRGNLEEAMAPIQALIDRYDEVMGRMGDDLPEKEMNKLNDEFDFLQNEIDRLDGWNMDHLLDVASEALVLPPDDADVATLSGGERRRVALCKALLEKPDLLLLDEPTNHLDAETISWLEKTLREYPGTVIIVTHDRYFLDNITKWILEIENTRGIPFEGNYSSWLKQKQELLRIQEKKESLRQQILAHELEWINSTPAGRLKKNQARVNRYEELAGHGFEVRKDDISIQIPPGPRLGDRVLKVSGLCKGYDGRPLIDHCDFELPRGGIVGVIGPNGIGKTTLFRMIIGQEQPDAGRIELGETVQLSYVDQHRDALDDKKTVFEEISGGNEELQLGDRRINARAYLSRFNFRGPQQQKLVGQLSGGERNRVHLAKLLRTGGNLLLLDEPTNDLDVNTMRVLEEALIEFPGCAMVISHDRFFLNRICTHLLIFNGDGKLSWFEGNFESYEERVLAQDGERLLHRRSRYRALPK
ncbi:MAG: energy-dependent translational throttle protein EttA [Lentisphaeria bacterium]|nr:energy-dependent translational throttle protein EttA [Lentisphaeria bacterium]